MAKHTISKVKNILTGKKFQLLSQTTDKVSDKLVGFLVAPRNPPPTHQKNG